jgi:hypothetical protein
VAAIFTANAGTGPVMADGGNLFNNVAVNVAGGHANLTVAALTAATWETVSTAVYNQPQLIGNQAGVLGTGPASAVNPKYLLVPRALQLTGKADPYTQAGRTQPTSPARTSSKASPAMSSRFLSGPTRRLGGGG